MNDPVNDIDPDTVIQQTKTWIREVVIGCGFCPFASREFINDRILYRVSNETTLKVALENSAHIFSRLNNEEASSTALLVFSHGFQDFNAYLDMLEKAENLLEKEGYEGTYQLAGFHPRYIFAGTKDDDPSNYTNRSPYPILHFLREAQVSAAIDSYPAVNEIPSRNIAFAQSKGLEFMQKLLASCTAS